MGGRLLAISTDPPEKSREVVERRKLNFSVLSDPDAMILKAYGLAHEGGGPRGATIAMPAIVLINPQGEIVWRRKAQLIQDRPASEEVLDAVARFGTSKGAAAD